MNIAGFQPNSFVDYPSHIAAVVFVGGCNMRCWYCHNEQILDTKEFLDENEILTKIEKNKLFLDGVVVSGGEPTLQSDLSEFIDKIAMMGLDVKLDTNGKRPDVLEKLLPGGKINYVAMDVKAPLDKYHIVTPTTTESEKVLLKSIELISSSGVDYEFRMTVIPQLTVDDVVSVAKMLKGKKAFYLQQYVDHGKGISSHPKEFFLEAQKAASEFLPTFVRGI